MDGNRVRRKDTTKGPPLRILSLDGGGVRGYSVLIILQELMHRSFVEIEGRAPKRHEIPKPCDHFDLIAGTGTGGLIAIMLGRLRMDVETCKDVYVRMTRKVFETDKTFAGIPYRSTLFKASKLEEAIMECVREHTIYDDEGNDKNEGRTSTTDLHASISPGTTVPKGRMYRSASVTSKYSQIGAAPVNPRAAAMRWGNPHALLYDNREERTKTAVAAVYKGTRKAGTGQVLLRSYDSRKEPAIAPNATIWQAGRATAATALAFKPIQIGQSVFLDEGTGKYNPAPMVLDEAACNEWPGREIGVFISIGTGKRPDNTASQEHLWWEGFVSGGIGDFAEARRKLIAKIEGCEKTHREMKDHLAKRQVNPENYYRLNVNVGVGEFGMNEWNALSDISTNTRMYLAEKDVQGMTLDASAKMARIHRAKMRHERSEKGPSPFSGLHPPAKALPPIPDAEPFAIELPADDVTPEIRASMHSDSLRPAPLHLHNQSDNDKYLVVSSDEYPQPTVLDSPSQVSPEFPPPRNSGEAFSSRPNTSTTHSSPRMSFEPPPRPPKTPLQDVLVPPPKSALRGEPHIGMAFSRPPPGAPLPYPDEDGPPPIVNKASKPASKPDYMREW